MNTPRLSRGFTLIELTLATALAVILLGCALAVFGGIARDRARLVLAAAPPSTLDNSSPWIELLRHDLAAGTDWRQSKTILTIHSCHAIDPKTMETVDRPCLIRYRLIQNELFPSWLVREQEYLDEVGSRTNKELISLDIRRFEVRPLIDGDDGINITILPQAVTSQNEIPPSDLARRVTLTVGFDNSPADVQTILCLQ